MPKVSPEHFKKRRADILDAAKRVFTIKGFEPTTMQDIVEESGMSRGGVYQYFSSTEEMFIAIREESFEEFEAYLNKLSDEHETVWTALMAYLDNYIKEPETEQVSFGLVSYEYSVVAWRKETHRRVIFDQAMKATALFVQFLENGVTNKEFSPRYPLEAIVLFIFNVTDGLLLHHMIAGKDLKSVYLKEQVDGLKHYLQLALKNQTP
jgi:AcrR family transcriptional regulator